MRFMKNSAVAKVAIPVALIAVLCLAVVAQGRDDDNPASEPTPSETLAKYFRVFAEDRESDDAIPGGVGESFRKSGATGPQIAADGSRRALTVAPDGAIYLAPTDEGVCAVVSNGEYGSPTCATLDEVERGVPVFGELLRGCEVDKDHSGPPTCKENLVIGIAPGASAVTLGLGDDSTASAKVSNGVFAVAIDPDAYVEGVTRVD